MVEMAERTRVDFNAPVSLVERADALAGLIDVSRTHLLTRGLREVLEQLSNDESVQHLVREAYYDGEIEFETVRDILGTDEAMRMQVLKSTIDQDLPEPQLEGELPTPEEFYDGEIPKWVPENADEEEDFEPLVD